LGLAQFVGAFITEVSSGPRLAAVAAQVPLSRIMLTVPLARKAVAEMLRDPGKGLLPPNEDFEDMLTVFAALLLIRIEDLGGGEAVTELCWPHEYPYGQIPCGWDMQRRRWRSSSRSSCWRVGAHQDPGEGNLLTDGRLARK
jgi:hypothetical protein